MNKERLLKCLAGVALVFCLLPATAQEYDPWGGGSNPEEAELPEVPAPRVFKLEDGIRETRKGKRTDHTVYVKNISTDTMLIYSYTTRDVKSAGKPAGPADVATIPNPLPAIKLLPGETKTILTVVAERRLEPVTFKYNYWYKTISVIPAGAGKPKKGLDYAIFEKTDTIAKEVTWYLINFSDRPLVLKKVAENPDEDIAGGFGNDWARHAVTDAGPNVTTTYTGPKKPEKVKPQASILIWKEKYKWYNSYADPFLEAEVEFGKK